MKSNLFSMKGALLLTLIFGLMAGNLAAQTFTSPTSNSGSSLFSSDADDYIDVNYYTAVEMDKWFGFASFADTSKAVVGYAQKIGSLYVAAQYSGTLFENLWAPTKTESVGPNYIGGSGWKAYSATDITPPASGNLPDNNLGVLIGVGNMGFRLSLSSNHVAFKDTDFSTSVYNPYYQTTTLTLYKSYEADTGNITPQLAWGMTEGLITQGIQPWITLNLGFNRDYVKQETYNGTMDTTTQGEQVTQSNNYFGLGFAVGLGEFTLVEKDNFRAYADFTYNLSLPFYDNEYSFLEYSGQGSSLDPRNYNYKTVKISGYNDGTNLDEYSAAYNTLTPSLGLGWSTGDQRLALKAKLDLGVSINGSTISNMALDSTVSTGQSLKKNGSETKSSIFIFSPGLDLAVQYQLIPNKLTLTAGGSISGGGVTLTTVESESFTNDKAVTDSKTTASSASFNGVSTSLTAGVKWNITNNFWFEGNTGISSGNSVHLLGNVITFSQILAGIKF